MEVGAEEDEGAVDDGHVVAEEQTCGGCGGGSQDDIEGGFFRLLHEGPLSGIAGQRPGAGDGIPAKGRWTATVRLIWFRAIQAIIYWVLGAVLLFSIEKLHFCDYNLTV